MNQDFFALNLGRLITGPGETQPQSLIGSLWSRLTGVDQRTFRLSGQQFATHMAIIGPTGAGKSRFMWQIMREHRRQRRGFCVIDDGDLANDFLADCAAEILFRGRYSLLKKLYWIKLNPFRMVRYDPWNIPTPEGIHPELRRNYLICSRHKRVQQFMQVTQANVTGKTDFMNQPRRQRILTNAFSALSIAVNDGHLAMEDVFIFFNPNHGQWRRTLDRCIPFLAPEIVEDMEMLGAFKNRPGDLWQQVESSVNSLRALLGPCMKQMLSATGREPCFDWKSVIRQGGYVIIDAHQDYAGPSENIALASLMALDLGETMLTTPKHQRQAFTLMVDEAAQFLGPLGREFARWLRIMRKFGMPCVLAFQDLASMRLDDLDLRPVILGQCGTIVCFRSQWHEDNEVLARRLMTGNLKFVPLVQDDWIAKGEYDWVPVKETSRTEKHDVSHTVSDGSSEAQGTNWNDNTTRATQDTTSDGESKHRTRDARGHPLTEADAKNKGHARGTSTAVGRSDGGSLTAGTSHNEAKGVTQGWAVSESNRLVPLAKIVHDIRKTGKLEESISDQIEQQRQLLHGLEDRHAIVLAPGMSKAIEIVTQEVKDEFESAKSRESAVKWAQREIANAHPFYFVPSFDAAEQYQRVEDFVGRGSGAQRPKDPLAAPADKAEPFQE